MPAPKIHFDSLVKPHWSASDKQKAALVVEFVQLIMNDHRFDEVLNRFGQAGYQQHNRTMADGIEGVVNTLRGIVKRAPEFSYDVKHIFVDGDRVILHSHATLKASHRGDDTQGLNNIDIWKVDNGQLVEHWDAVQGLSLSMRLFGLVTGGRIKNNNGVF